MKVFVHDVSICNGCYCNIPPRPMDLVISASRILMSENIHWTLKRWIQDQKHT